jgi:formate dehydrogenase (NADP+) alpha subunit
MIKQAVRYDGAGLTLVDPFEQGLTPFSSSWLRPRPGTYSVFLTGLLNEILSCREKDADSDRSEWFELFLSHAKSLSLKQIEEITGIPAKLIVETAERFADAQGLAVIAGASIAGEREAYQSGMLLALLVLLTGNVGKPGCGLFPLAGSLNDQGAMDMGALPERLPGYRDPTDSEAKARFEQAWCADLPSEKGLDYISMIEAAERGELTGLYVVGENPVLDCSETEKVQEALSRLEFLVVQDCFLTQTAGLAHVVLPSTSFAEKDGTFTSSERRVQTVRGAITPVGRSRPDWEIITELLKRLGVDVSYQSPNDILLEINDLVPIYGGITPERLRRESVFWPCYDQEKPDVSVLYTGELPKTVADAKLELAKPVVTLSKGKHHFWLIIGESLFNSADRTAAAYSRILQRYSPADHVVMNPFDAEILGIENGATANIVSKVGSVKAPVTFAEEQPRGMLLATKNSLSPFERLFAMADRDPVFGTPRSHRIAVRVEVADE